MNVKILINNNYIVRCRLISDLVSNVRELNETYYMNFPFICE